MSRKPKLFAQPHSTSSRKKHWSDSEVEQAGKRLSYSAIGRAAFWYGALRLSPSYEMARQCKAGELPEDAVLPTDFATVLSVFDDLGDVRVDIDDWTRERAFRAFGLGGEKPRVVKLGIFHRGMDSNSAGDTGNSLHDFANAGWIEQGERATLVAAIPRGMPKAQMMKQVAAMLAEMPDIEHDTSPVFPKYRVTGNRAILASARKYLRCMELKAAKPDLKLWQIGAQVKLSSTYSRRLNPMEKLAQHEQTEDRTALKILTSRALNRGHMIAENAARGIFPSYNKCEHALAIDWAELGKRLV